ncbi:MAG: cytochrome P460 family protein [Spirochaetota bacterium]
MLAIVLAATSLLLVSCPRPDARGLLPPDWRSWRKTTELVLNYPIPGHEDRLRVPRMNDTGFSSVPNSSASPGTWDFPPGTIIAKEVYASKAPAADETPIIATAMIKAPGDPRAKGGWIWVSKDLATGKESVFTTAFCVTCHANANEAHPYGDKNPKAEFRDFVFIVPLASTVPAPAAKTEYGAAQ